MTLTITKALKSLHKIILNRYIKAIVCLMVLCVICYVTHNNKTNVNRDLLAEHKNNVEEIIVCKTMLADKLRLASDRASADEISSEVKTISGKIKSISNRDAALSREMTLESWEKAEEEIDKPNQKRAKKAHEEVLRQIYYLKKSSYFGSDLLLRALK